MVDKRWAMAILLLPFIIFFMASWIRYSVSLSILLVASSRTSILGSLASARAKAMSCLWPVERFDPPSETMFSYFFFNLLIKLWALTYFAYSIILLSSI